MRDSSSDTKLKEHAARTLANLSNYSGICEPIVAELGIALLLDLVSSGTNEQK